MKRKYCRRKKYFIDTIATLLRRSGQIINQGVEQMMKINLLGKPSDPLVNKPDQESAKKHWQDLVVPAKMVDAYAAGAIRKAGVKKYKITFCSCGKHPVNPNKDVYRQHNHWLRQQMGGPVELGYSQLQDATPIGASIKKFEPTYDFSGEDFEMSPEELRKVRDDQEK